MSYEPLHHKYRPQSFAQLVGQEAIATTLTNAIRTSKIAPAYLFTGPRGTGKTSSARILAKSLNCLSSDKPNAEPCGVCDVCRGITNGSTLDVIEIDAASNTGVDNIREIIERAQFAPVQCRYKVYVIDECHMLSTQAFNALLKTLEEPPNQVVFVLATTDPQRVLPTIISRCQRFDFRRIPMDDMVNHLSIIAEKESININPQAITLVAQFAQGGLRDAESLLDQLSLLSGEVTLDKVWDLVGSVNERDLLALLQAIASDNPEAVLEITRNILDRGREPLIILQNLAAFYRDLLIAKTAPLRPDLVSCTQQTWQNLITEAQKLSINTILVGQEHLRSAEVQLKNTTVPRLWLEVTLLGLLPTANSPQPITINSQSHFQPILTQDTTPNIPPVTSKLTTSNLAGTPTQVEKNNNTSSLSTPQPAQNSLPTQNIEATSQKVNFSPSVQPQPTSPRQETQEDTNSQINSPANSPANSQINSQINSQTVHLDNMWQQVIQSLPTLPARSLLSQHGRLLEMSETTATVGFPPNLVKIAQGKLTEVEIAFAKVRQQKIKVKFQANQPQGKTVNNQTHTKVNPQPTIQPASPNQVSNQLPNQQLLQKSDSNSNTTLRTNQPLSPTPIPTTPPAITSENVTEKKLPQKPDASSQKPSALTSKTNNSSIYNSNPEAEKVERSAQSLAHFFDGEVVQSSSLTIESEEEIEF
ncbi:MAG: DNA polymerase III subunit gamma/tau [Cyanobacteria bacterium P01_A01_bin.84]